MKATWQSFKQKCAEKFLQIEESLNTSGYIAEHQYHLNGAIKASRSLFALSFEHSLFLVE